MLRMDTSTPEHTAFARLVQAAAQAYPMTLCPFVDAPAEEGVRTAIRAHLRARVDGGRGERGTEFVVLGSHVFAGASVSVVPLCDAKRGSHASAPRVAHVHEDGSVEFFGADGVVMP